MNKPPKSSIAKWARRILKIVLIAAVVIYIAICILMTIFQRSLMYYPSVATAQQVDQGARSASLERWTNSNGECIGMKRMSAIQPARGTILITYGNGSSSIGCSRYADGIQRALAVDVYILEYPGYQDRPGHPTQSSLFKAADESMQALPKNKPVYVVGESLGCGVASYLAGTHSNAVAGILLISPFNNMVDEAQSHCPILPVTLMVADRYPSDKYLENYHGKVGMILGGRDEVIPPKLTRRLFDNFTGAKRLWEVPNGGHCPLPDNQPGFWKEVFEFWTGVSEKNFKA